MKKKLSILFLSLSCVFILNAQTKYGIKGSIGFASGNGSYANFAINAQSVIRPGLGLTLDFNGNEKFNWQSGLLFNGFGGKYENENSSTTVSIYTFSIPILAKYKFAEKFYGYAGPELSFSMSGKAYQTDYDNYTKKTTNNTEDVNSHVKKPMIFGVVGANYLIKENLSAFAEYNFGIDNVVTGEPGAIVKFNLFSIGVNLNLTK